MRSLVLVSDAFGGRGGIALYNRHFLKALCSHLNMDEVVALPRVINYELEEMPENLKFVVTAAGGRLKFLSKCFEQLFSREKFDFIVCGHLNLLPVAFLLKLFYRCPVIPIIYGVEAWNPTSRRIANYLSSKVDTFVSIRKLTAHRFKEWANIKNLTFLYLPNCIDESVYGLAKKRKDLVEKYDLADMKVIMTAGRMDKGEIDRNKGFDEIMELIPKLRGEISNLRYLIVGDGDDKSRLEEKAVDLDINDLVKFAGYVTESDKADFYRLADVFVMPGSNPIFDRYPFRFVFLEALACGVPVVGCRLEDESECNDLLAQKMVVQVDPNSENDIKRGILAALKTGTALKEGVEDFYYVAFEKKLHEFLDGMQLHKR
jgi:glycosyltransferase involved in cell wall biosynthesis